MPRIKVPSVIKKTLQSGETAIRIYHRNPSKNWVPCGWAITDSSGFIQYTLSDLQVIELAEIIDLLPTPPNEAGDRK